MNKIDFSAIFAVSCANPPIGFLFIISVFISFSSFFSTKKKRKKNCADMVCGIYIMHNIVFDAAVVAIYDLDRVLWPVNVIAYMCALYVYVCVSSDPHHIRRYFFSAQ